MTYPRHILTKTAFTPGGPAGNGSAPGIWRLEEVAYWQKQGVWPNPNILPDSNFRYVSLLLSTTTLGNANNKLFADSSGAFNPISSSGNTTQGSLTPYGDRWGWNFSGVSSRYFLIGASSAFALGTGDFTLEAWFQQSAKSYNFPRFFNLGPSNWDYSDSAALIIDGNNYAGKISFETWSGIAVVSTTTVQNGTWYHVALTRSGSTFKLYVNGILETTVITSTAVTTSATVACRVGGGGYINDSFNGNVSNFRLVKGSVVYSSNFTPSTTPLTAISGTSLLTCQSNRFIDASSNGFTMTPSTGQTSSSTVGNDFARVTSYNPFPSSTYTGISYNQSDITNWSGYFDGTGDYLTVPDNAALEPGSSNLTWEMWINTTNSTQYATFYSRMPAAFATGMWSLMMNLASSTAGDVGLYVADYTTTSPLLQTTGVNVRDGAWHHIAVVRNGSSWVLYVDGVSRATATWAGTIADIAGGPSIGRDEFYTRTYLGYISNLRIVKGTAVYTAAFTPPTTNLTAISGTSLLTCQNAAFSDNSTNNFVVTPFGNTTVTGNSPFNPVGYWSNRFSSGNYLTVPNSTALNLSGGAYTIEMWINPDGDYGNYNTLVAKRVLSSSSTAWEVYLNTGNGVLSFYNGSNFTSSTTPTAGVWSHVAAVYDGANINIYLNGTRLFQNAVANNDVSASIYVGTYPSYDERFIGNMSNLRITKGAALYSGASFTTPTGPLTTTVSSGTVSLLTCQSPRFIDNSANAATVTVTGTPLIQPINPFYTSTISSNGGSLYFDGSGDHLTSPTSQAYNFASGNFTIEGWFYFSSGSSNSLQTLFSNYTNFSAAGSIFFGKHTNNSGYVTVWFSNYSTGAALLAETTYPPNNAWTHYALVRNGNTFTLYRNGVSTASTTWSGAATSGACPIWIGTNGDGTQYSFSGYMSGFRITKGTAVYTSAFSPPTAPLTPSGGTTLLLNGMNAGAYDATAINDMETVGNAQVSTAVSKFGGSSIALDGTGDYLKAPNSDVFAFRTGDFTVEMWAYFADNAATNRPLFDTGVSSNTGRLLIRQGNDAGTSNVVNAFVSGTTVGSPTISFNQWTHVAVVRQSGTVKIYINGTGGTGVSASADLTQNGCLVGAFYDQLAWNFTGYIDDLRVTRGVARYTTNFTPPTTAFPLY